ncbi:hypothetical protein HYN59_11305 [Flavobacterium album]|uniref:PsbP C-terminal domain-containing protein n=1 Tax=Flavobacterium album TaxID=2175091 RepID=A0A2S1QZ13_9FLAO|nr:hypothetical protein [Flavobacterium album]AWH85657.1 hypothetical protein HYN59_11305 [Flavobacterium album]
MKKFLLIGLVLFFTAAKAQTTRYENKAYGFSMDEPAGWIWANNDDLKQNLNKLDLDNAKLLKIISDHKGSLLLMSFYKYDPMTHGGLIPAIQVNVREKKNKDFEVFKSYVIKSANSFKDLHSGYEYIDEPQEIKINKVKSLYFSGKFSMKTQAGVEYKVRSRTYVIPHNEFYFQLTFTDGFGEEDNSKEFEALIKSIKIEK